MGEFTIRTMHRSDIPDVVSIENAVYATPWSPRVFFDELAMENRRYLVVENARSIVGFGGLLVVDRDAHITTVAIAPESRGKRLGVRLMLSLVNAALAAEAKHLTLEVRVSNTPAQGLYERFGFQPVGRRKNYYQDEDALVMWATDIDTPEYAARIAELRASVEEGMS
ncbi:MAG: ribosomal protein S18-alanine N-acetyltransferase [Acidimicrobiia bacterium]|nr:ribosomal protein S18-alanine N-acetyltransferase [Acidimicrobiia bacterium]